MKKLLIALAVSGVMTGCANSPKEEATTKVQPVVENVAPVTEVNNDDIYVAYHHNRENVFYDAKTYKDFLSLGETSFRKTYIGGGTNGMTVVYGLTKADKNKLEAMPGELMMTGKLEAAQDFYAEVFKHDRFYVFSTWADFDGFVKTGTDNLRYVEIGSGPKGETVVYILNKDNKKKKPEALIAKFKETHGIK